LSTANLRDKSHRPVTILSRICNFSIPDHGLTVVE
jgi:hypothetical protein